MRGHIKKVLNKNGSTSWHIVVDSPPGPGGKRRQKTGTYRTRKEAERAVNELIKEFRSGTYRDEAITVAIYLDQWLAGKLSIRASTRRSYAHHIDGYLKPYLGHVRLVDLRAGHIAAMQAELRANGRPGPTTIRLIHATLRGALNQAVRRDLLTVNPANHVEQAPAAHAAIAVWSPAQVQEFLLLTQDDRLGALYHLYAYRGLRRGEAIGLRWADIDLDAGTMRIQRQVVESGSAIEFGPPKTKTGARTVSLDKETIAVLRSQRARQNTERLAWGELWSNDDLVFSNEDGTVLRPSRVSRRFERLIREAGLPRIRLHDLRHTSASVGLQAGESLKEVSARLGHSTIVITADTYAHISPELARESAERLARLVRGENSLERR